MKYFKLFEQHKLYNSNPYDSQNYIDEYLFSDGYEIYEEDLEEDPSLIDKILQDIQYEIDNFKAIEYPVHVYRGLEIHSSSDEYPQYKDDLGCWSTKYEVAASFGNKIFHGIIYSIEEVDIEQTIRTRVLNNHEDEINVKDSTKVKIIDVINR